MPKYITKLFLTFRLFNVLITRFAHISEFIKEKQLFACFRLHAECKAINAKAGFNRCFLSRADISVCTCTCI